MSVFLSPVGGAGAQFFDNNGNPLTGGKLYTYAAGTTTPQATYTSAAGSTFHTNPIVLDAAGRVPGSSEIWLADSQIYKFVLKDSNDVLLATWDQITGVNSNFVNYTTETEVQTATAGQTVFTLTTMSYAPGTGSLTVYVDGVNQYEGDSYLETNSTTVTFTAGLHVGAQVKFTTAVQTTGNATDASVVSYTPPFTGGVATTVEDKLAQTVSVKDFGAVGDGVTDDTAAIQAALNSTASSLEFPAGYTFITSGNTIGSNKTLIVNGTVLLKAASPAGTKMFANSDQVGGNTGIRIIGNGTLNGNKANQSGTTNAVWHTLVDIENCDYFEFAVAKITGNYFPIATPSDKTTGAVYVRNSDYVQVHDSLATDYGREAFWCENCDYTKMFNLRAIGGADSWSGMQQSGDYCNSGNWYAEAAGASGASFDCQYSVLTNVVIKDNLFFNGLNCGHSGIPASNSVISGVTVDGAAQNGINIGANTVDLSLSGFNINTTVAEGINISDGANRINIADGVIEAAGSDAINIFATGTVSGNTYNISGVTVVGAGGYAVRADACSVMLNGMVGKGTAGSIGRFNSAIVYPTGCWFDRTAAKFGFQAIAGLGAGGTVTVTNANVTELTLVNVEASNVAGAAAHPYISAINDGSFVISTELNGAAGAGCRWWIG